MQVDFFHEASAKDEHDLIRKNLNAVDETTGATCVIPVPDPRPADYVPIALAAFLDWLGYPRVVIKADHEAQLKVILRRTQQMRTEASTLPRFVPKGSHQTMGVVENMNSIAEGHLRTQGLRLEERCGEPWSVGPPDGHVVGSARRVAHHALDDARQWPHFPLGRDREGVRRGDGQAGRGDPLQAATQRAHG